MQTLGARPLVSVTLFPNNETNLAFIFCSKQVNSRDLPRKYHTIVRL